MFALEVGIDDRTVGGLVFGSDAADAFDHVQVGAGGDRQGLPGTGGQVPAKGGETGRKVGGVKEGSARQHSNDDQCANVHARIKTQYLRSKRYFRS